MIKNVSILGCGWLGLPLAEFLVNKGLEVKGSTTHADKVNDLNSKGIQPYLVTLNPDCSVNQISDFLNSDLLIVNIPPAISKNTEGYHVEQMQNLYKHIADSQLKNIIYISSTSVYPDLNKRVVEDDVSRIEEAENKTLFAGEEIFRKQNQINVLVIRCAGLAGYDRNLVKHFAGKKNLKMGNAPVNLIHRDDVIGIIYSLIQRNKWNETYNICAPIHPLRKDLYPAMAIKYGYELPHYNLDEHSSFKLIHIEKIQSQLNYDFKFPDPYDFYYTK